MENINIKVILNEVFGKSCDSINNKQENKFKNVSDDEIYAELKRRKANKSAK